MMTNANAAAMIAARFDLSVAQIHDRIEMAEWSERNARRSGIHPFVIDGWHRRAAEWRDVLAIRHAIANTPDE
jgi:hypothetical protein